ncbi:Multicopper oxidase type 2 [Penicillium angulare]|uniref:Multicopper oxidase type 2 n=1 Tax=Penicillium angulare TaxID=116970 RepID=UPI0025418523|nr:Multicopper oxidase type 2 [Penicillium angulare]KAJ5280342.1 Multicopper oxidase type 2 [Penicillium angulare]
MAKLNLLLLAGWAAKLAAAKDVYLDWNITWVNASPDGFERPVIGINGQWPCPQVDVDVGDRLIVDVYNGLGNQSTGIHWHGIRQFGTGSMDGASSTTQCPLPPGEHMQYSFDVNQTGTYWYHSHTMGQYPDGLRGPLIVHDPSPPFQYDEEITITLSDWYHGQMVDLLQQYQSQQNEAAFMGNEPIPDSALINDSTNTKIKILPNKTYLVHVVCLANWPGHAWVLDGHEMTVVEVDGVYTEPYPVGDKMLRVAPGQRTSVLFRSKPDTSKNFAIWDTMDINMMFIYENRAIPANYNPNATAYLVYDESKPLPAPPSFNELIFVDDVEFVPADRQPLLQPVNHQIILDTDHAVIDGRSRFTINNKTYIPQEVPTLYTANTVGSELASNPEVYGDVNPIIVKHGEVVELVINNHHNNLHPWHLHGHQFQVLQRSAVDGGYFNGQYFKNNSQTPVRRDTIMVQNHGHTVLRFRADNPGVWLLHCHIEWHVEAGLTATIIEAPETFPQSVNPPPQSHYGACNAYGSPKSGNAAGHKGLDLNGANTQIGDDHGAMYPPPGEAAAPAPQPETSAPSAPAPAQQSPPPVAAPAPAPEPTQPESPPAPPVQPAPKPTHTHRPPPWQPAPQVPPAEAPAPAPQAPAPQAPAPQAPAPQAPAPAQPAPQVVPEYSEPEPVEVVPTYPPPHDEPVYAHSHDSKGPWPQPHVDQNHAQIGNGHDGRPPTYGHTEDTKGPWPNPHNDVSQAQVPDGPDGKPIVAHTDDTKGLWPHPHNNNEYVKEGGHTIHPAPDSGPNDLPEGFQYWGQYTE